MKNTENYAEEILTQLRIHGMLRASTIAEKAADLYSANQNVSNIEQCFAIIESLKLFIEAYKFDEIEKGRRVSMIKPKLLMFIAMCNYKLNNINRAYCIAKQGLDAIEKTANSPSIIQLPRSAYGAGTLEKLIAIIEMNDYECIIDGDNYYDVDPKEYCSSIFETIELSEDDCCKPSKTQIKQLIESISRMQAQVSEAGRKKGDGFWAFEINQMFENYKMPLYFAWRGYGYGWHTDFCEEGDSLIPYIMFQIDCTNKTKALIDIIKEDSPFMRFERSSKFTKSLVSVYTRFISDVENGSIVFK